VIVGLGGTNGASMRGGASSGLLNTSVTIAVACLVISAELTTGDAGMDIGGLTVDVGLEMGGMAVGSASGSWAISLQPPLKH
jgi:hypothetical protein